MMGVPLNIGRLWYNEKHEITFYPNESFGSTVEL